MYKLRDGVELPETFKIKVTPEQSEVVQKHLFSKGVSWASGHPRWPIWYRLNSLEPDMRCRDCGDEL